MKVLFIASNPLTADQLNTEAEIVEIQRLFIEAGPSVSFRALPRVAIEDLPREIARSDADIIHISSHGDSNGLQFSNGAGQDVLLDAEAFVDFLSPDRMPKVIYINACRSAALAKRIGEKVPAIGCNALLTNRAGRAAALAFYDNLLNGKSLYRGFTVARRLVEVCEKGAATMKLHSPHDTNEVLYNPPKIIARFQKDKTELNDDGFMEFELAVVNAPPDLTQVVFFTDDGDSAQAADDDENSLEGQLCIIARGTPVRGVLWSQDIWPEWGDVRLFATGVTGSGVAFTIETTLCKALEAYYQTRKAPPPPKIEAAIQMLRRLDGSDLDHG